MARRLENDRVAGCLLYETECIPHEYQYIYTYLDFFSESARLAPPWHLRGSHFDNASLHYLRNGPAFLCFLARPLLFLFLLVSPVVS